MVRTFHIKVSKAVPIQHAVILPQGIHGPSVYNGNSKYDSYITHQGALEEQMEITVH